MPVSVLIPLRNEEKTIRPLIERLHRACMAQGLVYEAICVNDGSRDQSAAVLQGLTSTYLMRVIENHKRGKKHTLTLALSQAKYPIIATIDADLQYDPAEIPGMVSLVEEGRADLVLGTRIRSHASLPRRIASWLFRHVFNHVLLSSPYDAHSALKVFRRDMYERIAKHDDISLDLELVSRAINAGYAVATVDIELAARAIRSRYFGWVETMFRMLGEAWHEFVSPEEYFPFSAKQAKALGNGFHYRGDEFVHHTSLQSESTAFHRVDTSQLVILGILVLVIGEGMVFDWHTTLIVMVAVLTGLYFVDLLFNLYLIYRSFAHPTEVDISTDELSRYHADYWPTYTILCPLYHEATVVPQFVAAMSKMDYPKDKLQVLLILEEDDKDTVREVEKLALPSFFEVLIVPDSKPKTKPKACNYGLKHATGEYITIYDAEDVPDPLQLKKAVRAFAKAHKNVVCMQAKLNFYNPHQNLLTKIFTAEYSLWFDLVLTGLHSVGAPIPLGGTSNHFRTADLRYLRGWDAFNVTEDCDLGMRLVKHGCTTAVINSVTYEEANSNLRNWIQQRTRWIKGYIQTYLVHMRSVKGFMQDLKKPHFLTFQLVVGGKVLSMFINPLMWTITMVYFALRARYGAFIETFFPMPVLYMGVFSLIFGNFLYMYYYMIGCAKRGHDDLIKYVFFVPFYWLAMSVAAWIAVAKMFTDPHHWAKTKHGLHLHNERAMDQASNVVGYRLAGGVI